MIFDFCKAKDELNIDLRPAPKVFCVCCKSHIYYLKTGQVEKITLEDLAPLKDTSRPTDWHCPNCGKIFAAFENSQTKVKTDRGYLP